MVANTIVKNPYRDYGVALNLSQITETYRAVDEIIEALDPLAMKELMSGTEKDVDKLLQLILDETFDALYKPKAQIIAPTFGYLDKLAQSVDQTLRLESFNYFTATVLPDFEMNWHHVEWGNLAQMYRFLCIIAARDHSKSFTFSKAYPLWKMYRYVRQAAGPNQRKEFMLSAEGMLISEEQSLGVHLLAKIKQEIEDNEILREVLYPGATEGWAAIKIKCKNGAQLYVKSYNSSMRGRHPGWIVVDDFLKDSALYSKDQREKYIDLFKSVIENMIVPDGQIICVGTPYHQEDLYGYLKRSEAWKVFEYPAVDPYGNILWETRHNLKSILDKRESQGSIIFSREILVKPVTSESTIFPYEMVQKCFRTNYGYALNGYSLPTKFKRTVLGCDFARSANVGADYSVFTTIGIDEHDRYWILNIQRHKGKTYDEQIAIVKHLHASFRYDVIIMEANQMQMLFVDGARGAGLPVIPHTTGTNKYDLRTGLPSLAVLFENMRILMPYANANDKAMTELLALELASMAWTDKGLQGVGQHDDLVMSLLMSVIAARHGSGFDFAFV